MKYKVVIIDDEPWTREVIKSLGQWEELGLEVVGEASDGEYGLELIQHLLPDIIITDVRMPHLTGFELVQLLREKGNDALVIIISGYDDYSYIRNALKLGVLDYLLKPVKQEELNNLLRQCTHILEQRGSSTKQNADYSYGFLETAWADNYYELLNNLNDSLSSSDVCIIQKKFHAIQQLVERDNQSKGSMIFIYYSFMSNLQQFVSSSGYSIGEVFENRDTNFVFGNDSTLGQMLAFICSLYCDAVSMVHQLMKSRNRLDINKIKRYAEEHYAAGISLDMAAAQFYVSKEYLSKAFKVTVGKGFSEYVTELRMKRAKELILEYKVPIKDVGSLVGYVDQAHFYKTFKKFYGKTPGEIKNV
jgi:two-component system response regulator YesN